MEDIYAVCKYDSRTEMAGEWELYVTRMLTAFDDAGFTGFVCEAHPPSSSDNPEWEEELNRHINQQIFLLDAALARGMKVILAAGNPLNKRWGKVGPNNPAHALYTHPAVVKIKYGDEPTQEEWDKQEKSRNAITSAYPTTPLYSVFVGETIGGPTSLNKDKGRDTLPDYRSWWEEEPRLERWVRSYPCRSRDKDTVDPPQHGDYGVYKSYTPEKLAVPFTEMCRIMQYEGDWNLVMQTFGNGIETGTENYRRLPTKLELEQMAGIAQNHGVTSISCWSATPNDDKYIAIFNDNYTPMIDRNGTYPVDAISVIRDLYI